MATAAYAAAAFFLTSPAHAEKLPVIERTQDTEAIFSFSLENDYVAGDDDQYTNGVRFAILSAENYVPKWLEDIADSVPLFAREGHKRWGFAFGQSMFTPEDLTRRNPDPNDRPYAGWLYGSFGVTSDTGYRLDNFQLTLGVVGPGSLASETQDFVHDTFGYTDPQGWGSQLENEPGIVLNYERKWRNLYEFSPAGWGADLTPTAGAALGNVYTHAMVGAIARLGYDLPSDYGPPLIGPSLSGSDFFVPTNDIGWYLFAGFEGRAVARNIFLDGNTFEDSPSVDKLPFVGSMQGGIAFTYLNTRLAFTHIIRSKEFQSQPRTDQYSAVTVSYRF